MNRSKERGRGSDRDGGGQHSGRRSNGEDTTVPRLNLSSVTSPDLITPRTARSTPRTPRDAKAEVDGHSLGYDPDVAVGEKFLEAVSGFYCGLCHKFFRTQELGATHCKSEKHFEKYQVRSFTEQKIVLIHLAIQSSHVLFCCQELIISQQQESGDEDSNVEKPKSSRIEPMKASEIKKEPDTK